MMTIINIRAGCHHSMYDAIFIILVRCEVRHYDFLVKCFGFLGDIWDFSVTFLDFLLSYYRIVVWVTRPECAEGAKDEVKQARKVKS